MAVDNIARGLATQAPPHPGYAAGKWNWCPLAVRLGPGTALAIGSVRLLPFYLSKTVRVSDLGVRITTGSAGGNIRLALYRGDPSTMQPTGTAVVETGNITTAGTGVLTASVITPATLAPGLYFMAVNSDNAVTVLQAPTSDSSAPAMFVGSATAANLSPGSTGGYFFYSFASAFGTFPDLTGQAMVEVTSSTNGCGMLMMKAS